MARPESVAIGGFFPTPAHLLTRFASLLSCKVAAVKDGYGHQRERAVFVDPCAGDAEAICEIANLVGQGSSPIYACEMEATRAQAARKRLQAACYRNGTNALHSDAFRVTWRLGGNNGGASLLYLNPPYDFDRVYGRLEHKFLERFTSILVRRGVLMFLVPHYALAASAELLAREYTKISCFKLPAADYASFKQVLLIAQKNEPLTVADPMILAQVQAWAKSPGIIAELPKASAEPLYDLPAGKEYELDVFDWSMRRIDLTALLAKSRPWTQTVRGSNKSESIANILPDLPVQDLLLRTYPLATPPRPAHIAAGIASGLFNGARIDTKTKGLPSLLVKGVFDREYRTIERKVDDQGSVIAEVQIQEPKLVTTVLDLETHKYHVLQSNTKKSEHASIDSFSVADLLTHYGSSLMTVMEQQCPVLYDPRRDHIALVKSPRKLFTAQDRAAQACVKLLGGVGATARQRRGKSAILLGEIGSGKSTVALMTLRTLGSKRPLVMCPPHLLTSWGDEIAAVFPDAKVVVLSTVDDIERVAADTSEGLIISVMSREAAKLSHEWEGVGERCPKCGRDLADTQEAQAKKRLRCAHTTRTPASALARVAQAIALRIARVKPKSGVYDILWQQRMSCKFLKHYEKMAEVGKKAPFAGIREAELDLILEKACAAFVKDSKSEHAQAAIVYALAMIGSEQRVIEVARQLESVDYQSFGRNLLLLLVPGSELQTKEFNEVDVRNPSPHWKYSKDLFDRAARVTDSKDQVAVGVTRVSWLKGAVQIDGYQVGNIDAACELLRNLNRLAKWRTSEECGEFLYQAVPTPRKVALAKHIQKHYADTFDFLVLDEGHEYANADAAQGRAAQRLATLGLPTILQTGSIMNGYAKSLFAIMWSLSKEFRKEFERDHIQRFVDRYGYRKRLIQDRSDEDGKIVEFGSMSDRITRIERTIGDSPGVLPLFLLRHLLPISVTLHKADLDLDLPACTQERVLVQPDADLLARFKGLQAALIKTIKEDRFETDRSGKLFGQLAELPSYLDRATSDTGNQVGGGFAITYPESVNVEVPVAFQEPFPASQLMAKERWLIERVKSELAEGRNVMVFAWHVNLLPRLARILTEHTGEVVPILHADKVTTAKRQDWITREVVKKKRRILVVNPVTVQTGLNNLIHFHTEIWMENPACNPTVLRQAIGRVHRIRQTRETRILLPVYAGTLQEQVYDLLMAKVAVAVSTDGLDPESMLQAAGVGEDSYFVGLSIGKQLWAMFSETEESAPVRPRKRTREARANA